ncbi:hypothetical protein Q7P37_005840 [Cladosporium fusiforme]
MSSIPQVPPAPARRKTRLSIACESCRYKHFRCDGKKPVCSRCTTSGKECVYPPSRRGNVKERARRKPIREDTSEFLDFNNAEGSQSGGVASVSTPNHGFNLSPDSQTIEGALDSDLLDLYYEFFHAAHPCALPRRFLTHRLGDDQLQLLVSAIYYIGSLFAGPARSEGRQEPIESALGDFRCGLRTPNGFDVQAVLLYSVAVYWCGEPSTGTALLEEAIRMATSLGINRKQYAIPNSHGDAVLAESWRRTWWQIFIADAHVAGSAHTFSFHTSNIDMTVDLPCEEHEYEAGTIPPPKSLQDYDMREFTSDDEVQFSSYAELIGLTRGLYLALSCNEKTALESETSICANVDISMTAWYSLLPPTKQCILQSDGTLDEMMFKAQFIMHTCTVEFHRRLSSLKASPIDQPATNVHTVKCIQAIRKIDELLVLPTEVTTHSPFLICMIANVTIANLSACRLILQGKDLAQHRQRIRLTLGTLKTLSRYWMLGKRTYEEIGIIARDLLFPAGKSSASSANDTALPQACAMPIQPSPNTPHEAALDFGFFLHDGLPIEYLEHLQEPMPMI